MRISRNKIELLLAEKGLSQKMLADKSGVRRQAISAILRHQTCTPRTAGKLADGLGVPVAEILEEVVNT